ncbi:MAG: GNAT family N-acetyltransferase [Marinosulfonomonas sp.]
MPRLVPARIPDKPVIQNMLTPYLMELSPNTPRAPQYPYLDTYWQQNQNRWPYLIKLSGRTIGFTFINQHAPSGQHTDFAMAEFYIRPDARKKGYGKRAAAQAFVQHPGQWELAVGIRNTRGKAFWTNVLAPLSPQQFPGTNETIFRFNSSGRKL